MFMIVTAEPQIQNSSTAVLGAVVGVAVILLAVLAFVVLRRRLVTAHFTSTVNAPVVQINTENTSVNLWGV